jgi:hypothetical protein
MARDEVDEDVDVGSTADEDVAVAGTVDEPAVGVGDDVSEEARYSAGVCCHYFPPTGVPNTPARSLSVRPRPPSYASLLPGTIETRVQMDWSAPF